MIYIIIPVFNRWVFTDRCLQSLQRQSFTDFQVVVVDHGSTDGTSHKIKEKYRNVILISGDDSMWWTRATNLGVKFALAQHDTTHILTLNNDLVVEAEYLQNMVNLATSNSNYIIGSISRSISNREEITFAGVKWNKWTAKYSKFKTSNTSATKSLTESDLLPGRGTLIPVNAFKKIGLFDEVRFPHYIADEDFTLQCRREGFLLVLSTDIFVLSETEETGLNKLHKDKTLGFWKDSFTSIRSPVNIQNKWRWALKNTPLPIVYFALDMTRIIISKLLRP